MDLLSVNKDFGTRRSDIRVSIGHSLHRAKDAIVVAYSPSALTVALPGLGNGTHYVYLFVKGKGIALLRYLHLLSLFN